MSSYSSLAPFYDALTSDVNYGAFADFYESIFALRGVSPSTVLDLACGTGNMCCLLAKRGYETIGTDSSVEMLEAAREKSLELSEDRRPLLLNQPMQDLDLYGTVDAAVCCLDGLNYLPPDDLHAALERVLLFLEPGGIFIFDVNSEEKLRGLDGQVFLDETDDVYCVWRAEFSEEERACIYGMDIFSRCGKKWERSGEEHVEYAYSIDELTAVLKDVGFENIAVYSELKLAPPEDGERRIFFAATKPGV